MKPRIFIDGEHGTTGLQIRARLASRDDLDVLSVPETERRNAALRKERLAAADVAILCLPDDAAREAVAMVAGNNALRIIDTSTAHRVDPDWTYGFAEMEPDQARRIASARLVANPGCYPTGVIGLIRPLRLAGLLPDSYPVTVNAVSGYSGGGKKMIAQIEDADHPDAITAPHFVYGLELSHKHLPEMTAHGLLAGPPLFSPSVGRFRQGMIVQLPLHRDRLEGTPTVADIHAVLAEHYAGRPAVEVVTLAQSRTMRRLDPTALNGTDRMQVFVFGGDAGPHVNLVARLDNLGKGASGAAVQNLDLMLGR